MPAEITNLFVYPLKSGAPKEGTTEIEVSQKFGVKGDRQYMLVHAQPDTNGIYQMITQRTPGMGRLATIELQMDDPECGTSFTDRAKEGFFSIFEQKEALPEPVTARVHQHTVKAYDAGDATSKDFSDYFKIPVRRLKLMDDDGCTIDPTHYQNADQHKIGFADGGPILVTTQRSLELVQAWAGDRNLEMGRFRPNIVIDGNFRPFIEDAWKKIKIGETVLALEKPCGRCVIPEIDQKTGHKNNDSQPTIALKEFRGVAGDKATRRLPAHYFGWNATVVKDGIIRAGDPVIVEEFRKAPHPLLGGIKVTGFGL